jgi:hypothetical protein
MNKKLVGGLLVAVGLICATTVHGQDWGGGYPYAPPWWGCYAYRSTYASESVPYFALHPPVYYSYRVARTYGYSPFAYPPGVMTPSLESRRSPSSAAAVIEETLEPQGPKPLRIDNPYVEQSHGPGVTQRRQSTGPQPKIVYPAALAQRPKT